MCGVSLTLLCPTHAAAAQPADPITDADSIAEWIDLAESTLARRGPDSQRSIVVRPTDAADGTTSCSTTAILTATVLHLRVTQHIHTPRKHTKQINHEHSSSPFTFDAPVVLLFVLFFRVNPRV